MTYHHMDFPESEDRNEDGEGTTPFLGIGLGGVMGIVFLLALGSVVGSGPGLILAGLIAVAALRR